MKCFWCLDGNEWWPNPPDWIPNGYGLVGLFPFTSELELSKTWVAWSVVLVTAVQANNIAIVVFSRDFSVSGFFQPTYFVQLFSLDLAVTFNILHSVYILRVWKDIFRKMSNAEKSIRLLQVDITFKRFHCWLDLAVRSVAFAALVIFNYIIFKKDNFEFWSRILGLYFTHLVLNISEVLQICVVSYLTFCVDKISCSIREPVEPIVEVYCILHEVAKEARSLYGLRSLFSVANTYVTVIIDVYMFLSTLAKPKHSSSNFLAAVLTARVCLRIYEVLQTTSAVHKFVEAMKNFDSDLLTFVLKDKSNSLAENCKIRLELKRKDHFVFSAHGFYSMDRSLFHSIAASMAAYIVMMLQVGGAMSK